jgi:hypothetical protein
VQICSGSGHGQGTARARQNLPRMHTFTPTDKIHISEQRLPSAAIPYGLRHAACQSRFCFKRLFQHELIFLIFCKFNDGRKYLD